MNFTAHRELFIRIAFALFLFTLPLAASSVVYTSLAEQDFLSALNPATGATTQPVSVAQQARDFALSPDGTTAYIAGQGITSINIATGKVLWKSDVTSIFNKVSVSPDGSQVYALYYNFPNLHVFDSSSGSQLAKVKLVSYPEQAVSTPNHGQIYVTTLYGVNVIDGNTFQPITTLNIQGDGGLAITPDGSKVYVSSQKTQYLAYVVDTVSNTVLTTIPSPNQSVAIPVVVSPDGSMAYFGTTQGLVEVSTATDSVTGSIASPSLAIGLDLATDGQYVYYTPQLEGFTPRFLQFDISAATYKSVPLGGSTVAVQVAAPTRSVYVLQAPDTVLTSDPVSAKVTGSLGVVNGTLALTLSADENWIGGNSTLANQNNQVLEKVSLINTSTHQVKQFSISVSPGGGSLVINANATTGYVVKSIALSGAPFTIGVVNLTTGTLQGTFPIPELNNAQNPALVLAPDNSALYVAGVQPSVLCRVALPDDTTTCVTPPAPIYASDVERTLAVSADGSRLYVPTGGASLLEYDARSLTVTRSIPVSGVVSAGGPVVLYSAAANSIFIAYTTTSGSSEQSAISRVGLASFKVVATLPTAFMAADLGVTPDGSRLLVAGAPSGTLVLNASTLATITSTPTGLTKSVVVAAH